MLYTDLILGHFRSLKEALRGLVNRNIIITTHFSGVTGQLIQVKDDYVVLRETGDSLVYIPIRSIELVTLVEEEEV
ncbi:DUF2642 domain-containing protein [Peribacillus sp. NPDC096448]|uniref:DUF2642 domain-containing protein n=1 Tax=Peribacillus sp. NPDC096448 TaxID=3364395 RepID=UPI00380BD98B